MVHRNPLGESLRSSHHGRAINRQAAQYGAGPITLVCFSSPSGSEKAMDVDIVSREAGWFRAPCQLTRGGTR